MNLIINFFSFTWHRFNIAIKSNRYVPQGKTFVGNEAGDNMGALMDEAKAMLEIGCYHENIVNLQGVTCLIDKGTIFQVILR